MAVVELSELSNVYLDCTTPVAFAFFLGDYDQPGVEPGFDACLAFTRNTKNFYFSQDAEMPGLSRLIINNALAQNPNNLTEKFLNKFSGNSRFCQEDLITLLLALSKGDAHLRVLSSCYGTYELDRAERGLPFNHHSLDCALFSEKLRRLETDTGQFNQEVTDFNQRLEALARELGLTVEFRMEANNPFKKIILGGPVPYDIPYRPMECVLQPHLTNDSKIELTRVPARTTITSQELAELGFFETIKEKAQEFFSLI